MSEKCLNSLRLSEMRNRMAMLESLSTFYTSWSKIIIQGQEIGMPAHAYL